MSASTRLSISNCRRSRIRLTPSASRMAISRERARLRPSIRLATFAQAMIRTIATSAIIMAAITAVFGPSS